MQWIRTIVWATSLFFACSLSAHANMKVMLCISGVKLSCQTAVNKAQLKKGQSRQHWLKTCLRLGIQQCKQRLGAPIKRKVVRKRRKSRRPTRAHRRPSRTPNARPVAVVSPRVYCRRTCKRRAGLRFKKTGRALMRLNAARTWVRACFRKCLRSRRASSIQKVRSTRRTVIRNARPVRRTVQRTRVVSPAARRVRLRIPRGNKAFCVRNCRKIARTAIKKGRFTRSQGRKWYKRCIRRCQKK